MTAAQRTAARTALDQARRAQLDAAGGYAHVERNAKGHELILSRLKPNPTAEQVADLERRLTQAHSKLNRMRARRDGLRDGTGRGWWHPAAIHLKGKGFTYAELADLFDVRVDTVRSAVASDYRRRRLARDRDRQRHLRAVA